MTAFSVVRTDIQYGMSQLSSRLACIYYRAVFTMYKQSRYMYTNFIYLSCTRLWKDNKIEKS